MILKRDVNLLKRISNNISYLRQKAFPGHGGISKCIKAFYGLDDRDDIAAKRVKWSKWENGGVIPEDKEQRRLAKFFKVSLAELRGELPVWNKGNKKSPAVVTGDAEDATLEKYLAALSKLAGLTGMVADPRFATWAKDATEALVALHQGALEIADAGRKIPHRDIQDKNTG